MRTIFKNNLNILIDILDTNKYIYTGKDKHTGTILFDNSIMINLGSQNLSLLLNFESIFEYNWGGNENGTGGSVEWEKRILLFSTKTNLLNKDSSRAYLGSVPFANMFFRLIILGEYDLYNQIIDNINLLQENNPFKMDYKNFKMEDLDDIQFKFKILKDYLHQVSFAKDAAGIGGMAGATDFTQLYNCIIDEDIISGETKINILKLLFNTLNSKNKNELNDNYIILTDKLASSNLNNNLKLSRLYNRLWYVFSYILNNIYPEIFPIYFPRTREVLRYFNITDYVGVCEFYEKFLIDDENIKLIDVYMEKIFPKDYGYKGSLIEEFGFITEHDYETLKRHAKYRFFQDSMRYIANLLLNQKNHLKAILFINFKKEDQFSLSKVYEKGKNTFNFWFKGDYIDAKIRQLFQQLRDDGIIEFLGNGQYKLLKNSVGFTFFD